VIYFTTSKQQLPPPDTASRAQSEKLCAEIHRTILTQGGKIPFSKFVEMALYWPELGYYTSPGTKIGRSGDFITAPTLSPLFSQCVASTCASVFEQIPDGTILEFGGGTGAMAADIVQTLIEEHGFQGQYYLLEPSAYLIEQQRTYLQDRDPSLLKQVTWLSSLPEHFQGVILANEVIDAFPVERYQWPQALRCWVTVKDSQDPRAGFAETWEPDELPYVLPCELPSVQASNLQPKPVPKPTAATTLTDADPTAPPHKAEWPPALAGWLNSVSACLDKGVLLLMDYGFESPYLFRPGQTQGSLTCHYRHHAHDDPYWYPGLQDMTAQVNFTALAALASQAGLDCLGYTTQAHFLIELGILDRLAQQHQQYLTEPSPANSNSQAITQYLQATQAIQTLLAPSEMGELVKVMALGKQMPQTIALPGFTGKDFRHRLSLA